MMIDVSYISYDSDKKLLKKLNNYSIQISFSPDLFNLMNKLRYYALLFIKL